MVFVQRIGQYRQYGISTIGVTRMIEPKVKKIPRRGAFWVLTRFIIPVLFVTACILGLLFEDLSFVTMILCFGMGFYFLFLLLGASFLMKKTASKIERMDFRVDWRCDDINCIMMIDTHKGKLATIWSTDPFRIHITDAIDLTDAKITFGTKFKSQKTTNRIGVTYWIGKHKYSIYTYNAGKMYVYIDSPIGKEYIQNAQILMDKLIMARDVAHRHQMFQYSRMTLESLIGKERISLVDSLVSANEKIKAVKIVKEGSRLGLAHCAEIVDNWNDVYYKKF